MALNVFYDPQEAAGWILSVILAPICIIATGLRFLATKRGGRKLGWEDWYALAALVFFLPYVGYLIWILTLANGRPLTVFIKENPTQWTEAAKVGLNMNGLYGIQQSFAKFSLLALYYRLFWVERTFAIIVWSVAIIQGAWGIVVLLVHIFACVPVAKSWQPEIPGHCVDINTFFSIYEPINAAIDFAMAGMAIWMLHALQMKKKTQWYLSGLFILGGFSGVIGIIKVVEAQNSAQRNFLSVIWNLIQMATSIICCCAPIYNSILPKVGFYTAFRSWASQTFTRRPSSSAVLSERKESGAGISTKASKVSSAKSGKSYQSQPKNLDRHAHWVHLDGSSERGLAWAEIEAERGNGKGGGGEDGGADGIAMGAITVKRSIDVV
ncbi:hypothetical protein F4805DRAFT_446956 [Annulohypoxylon moriforme]|nr:hypothetical protein F4805DRAFT_446956 [Annulohypoxylon moriforme]